MEATKTSNFSSAYKWAILSAYIFGIGVNLWLLTEMMKETEEGREILDRLNSKTIGRLRSWKNTLIEGMDSQLVIIEAEEILRGQNGSER
jgi:hypothetical protein